jgi:hypothetical protein
MDPKEIEKHLEVWQKMTIEEKRKLIESIKELEL